MYSSEYDEETDDDREAHETDTQRRQQHRRGNQPDSNDINETLRSAEQTGGEARSPHRQSHLLTTERTASSWRSSRSHAPPTVARFTALSACLAVCLRFVRFT